MIELTDEQLNELRFWNRQDDQHLGDNVYVAPSGKEGHFAYFWQEGTSHITREEFEALLDSPNKKPRGKKRRWHLLPWDVMEPIVQAFEEGADKYAPNDYRGKVDEDEYFSALMRHLTADRNGERIDPDSGNAHLAKAVACILILMTGRKDG